MYLSPIYILQIPLHIGIYALENSQESLFFKALHMTEKLLWINMDFLNECVFTWSLLPSTIWQILETTAGNTT